MQCFKDATKKEVCRAKEMHPGLGSKRKGPETALLSCKAKISLNKGEQKEQKEEMLRKQSRDEAERSGSASVVPNFSFPRC